MRTVELTKKIDAHRETQFLEDGGVSIIWGSKDGEKWCEDAVKIIFPSDFTIESFRRALSDIMNFM